MGSSCCILLTWLSRPTHTNQRQQEDVTLQRRSDREDRIMLNASEKGYRERRQRSQRGSLSSLDVVDY